MSGRGIVLGVDGGGTTTDVVVADLTGAVLASVSTGGTNHESIGVEQMVAVLAAAIDEALVIAGSTRDGVAASVFGLAGVDWPSDVEAVDGALGGLGLGGRRLVVNDSRIALRAGCAQPWGIVSSVGTGSVTAGVNRSGEWFRSMAVGWGEPSGASTLVRESLHAIAAAYHGTAPATALTAAYLDALDQPDVPSMFEAITRRHLRVGSHRAPLTTRVAQDGDAAARTIVATMATQQAELVIGVARHLDLIDDEFELVTSGGVHAGGGLFSAEFASVAVRGCPGATIVPLVEMPALGAVALALDLLSR
jgi:N-acetylglucosamine kinase-like BadF-type ATPase